ncbi:hypothetical protein [Deinococcus sp. YIM 77859]|uniref:hypothetical protein n=1 Tax=Deinococcus sp. YIM 77859 TaxID=1540221 RepID=UPI0005594C2F|nr:hypothetical protein [Deinococcus sp. YIM 77859]
MPKQQRESPQVATLEFPSPEAAWGFAQQAQERGHRVDLPERVNLFPAGMYRAVWVAALIGGTVLGLVGALAENFMLALPRLGPIFAAPTGAPTVLFAFLGGSVGALTGGLATLRAVPAARADREMVQPEPGHPAPAQVVAVQSPAREAWEDPRVQPTLVEVQGEGEALEHLALEWGGHAVPVPEGRRRGGRP